MFAIVDRDGTPTLVYNDDTAFTYVDIAANNDFIIAAYSARDRRRYRRDFAFARELHIFSWDGRLVRRTTLNTDVRSVRIDAESRSLYGVARSAHGGLAVVAFDLDAVTGRTREVGGTSAIQDGR